MHPTGKYVYISSYGENTISVISTEKDKVVGKIVLKYPAPKGMCIHPDGNTAYIAHVKHGHISVINLDTYTQKEEPIPFDGEPVGILMNPTGTRAYVTDKKTNHIIVLDLKTRTVSNEKIEAWGGLTNIAYRMSGISDSSYLRRLYFNLKETLFRLSPQSQQK